VFFKYQDESHAGRIIRFVPGEAQSCAVEVKPYTVVQGFIHASQLTYYEEPAV